MFKPQLKYCLFTKFIHATNCIFFIFVEMRHLPQVAFTRQKLILDEEVFEESFLRCMVCRELYDMNDRSPRLLPCHHAFCMSCIMTFYQKEAEYHKSMTMITSSSGSFAVQISCPHCAANFITTEEGLRQLTTDHRVVQLMDFIGHTDKQTVVFCPKHALQPLNFFCEKCCELICRDCTILDHKACAQDKLVSDIEGAIQKYKPAIEEGKNNLAGEVKVLEERKAECQKKLESCSKGDDTLANQIKETFDKLRKALSDREKELLELAKSDQGTTQEMVEAKIKSFTSKQGELAGILEGIDKALASGTVQDLFSAYRQIKDYKTEPALESTETENKDNSNVTFVARDETTMITRISNFGDIQKSTRQSNGYSGSTTTYGSSTGSGTSGYLGSSAGSSYLGSSRYGSYTGSSYTSRYTPRSYKY